MVIEMSGSGLFSKRTCRVPGNSIGGRVEFGKEGRGRMLATLLLYTLYALSL